MMIKRFKILLMLFMCTAHVRSQQKFMYRIEHPDGIQAHDVYSVYQDSKHYLWFTTDGGVWRFDGKTYKNFSTEQGLPDNVVFLFCEDHRGRLWFNTYSNKIAFIDHDRVYTLSCNDSLTQLKKHEIPGGIHVDRHGVVWLSFLRSRDYITISPPYKKENIHTTRVEAEFFAIEIEPGGMVTGSGLDIPSDERQGMTVFRNGRAITSDTLSNKSFNGHRSLAYLQRDGGMFVSAHRTLWEYKDHRLHKKLELPYCILSALRDVNNNYWIGTIDGGLYFYDRKDTAFADPEVYLKGKSVGRILQDHQGAFWITTLTDGVYYIPHIDLDLIKTPYGSNEEISFVFCHPNGKLYFTDTKGNLFIMREGVIQQTINTSARPDLINDIKYIVAPVHNKQLLLGRSNFWMDLRNQHKEFLNMPTGITGVSFHRDVLWIAKQSCLFKVNPVSASIDRETDVTAKINFIFPVNDRTLWLGTERGLLSYDIEKDTAYPLPVKRQSIISIEKLNDAQYLLVYKSDGLLVVNKQLNATRELTLHVKGYSIKHTTKDRFGTIWISTNKGILKIDPSLHIQHLTKHHGLATNIINAISTDSDFVYVATKKGLIKFPIQKNFKDTIPPDIYLNSVLVNNTPYAVNSSFHLPYDKNFIKILFSVINYRAYDKMICFYKMEGIDTHWKTTQTNTIEYTTLPPGSYQLIIYAVNGDGVPSRTKIRLHIIIEPPLWETWWFILTLALLLLSTVLIIFRWQLLKIRRRSRERSELHEQLSQMEMQALRSQMNPHFIFNAMNSIQHYILGNEPALANKFLVKFSKLVRNILEQSQEELIPLNEEIETLRFYIELEALRFEDSFAYAIHVSHRVIPEQVKIPPLILQPYVENAIWHGLLLKKGKKELIVNVSEREGYLFIEIDDNGIGREASARFKKHKTEKKSMAMEITGTRLHVLGKTRGLKSEIRIMDKLDTMGNSLGTTVTIKIPIIHTEHGKGSNH